MSSLSDASRRPPARRGPNPRHLLMFGLPALAVAILLFFFLGAFGQVKPGYVGLMINQYGSGAGVSSRVLGVGTYFTPPGTTIQEFPVFTQNYTYSASRSEGSAENEEFVFQDKSGLTMSTDLGVSYSVNPDKAPILYSKFRADASGLLSGQIRNIIRNALTDRASQMNVEDIYGPQKAALLAAVQRDVQNYFAPFGLNIERLNYAGEIRVPDSVRQQIVARVSNENAALAAQAAVATATADANARIEAAKGEAEANRLLAASIAASPQLVQLKAIEKWNGVLPTYAGGGALPFIGDLRAK
jgi:regulator of protease activity HflC (stomatin/prohibitin superfamily)